MAQIPVNYKLSFYDPAQPTAVITTVNENVNDATRVNTQYSMQDIIDTVGNDGLSKVWIMIPDNTTFLSPVPDTNTIRLAQEITVDEAAIKIGETLDFQADVAGTSNINQLRYSELQYSGVATGGFLQLVGTEQRLDIDNGGGGDVYSAQALVARTRLRGNQDKNMVAAYGLNASVEVEDTTAASDVDFQICLRTANEVTNANANIGFMYGLFYGGTTLTAGSVNDHRAIFIDVDGSTTINHTDYAGIWHDVGPVNVSGNKYFINNLMDAPIKTAGGMTFSNSLPAHPDDAAAGAAGLTAGQLYQTDGTAAAPLNAAGIVMIKQ